MNRKAPVVRLNSWDWDKKHKEKVARKYEKRETLRALLEMWESCYAKASQDQAQADETHAYILELRAKLRSVENQLAAMSL